MKMTKKLFLVAIATAAFALTSCDALMAAADTKSGTQGDGKTSGFKWNKKMTVDGNDKELYDKTTEEALANAYRRFIKKIKNDETVTNIATDIVIDLEKSVLATDTPKEGKGKAVVGLAFDFHTSEDKTKYDFVLVGFAPERGDNGSYYIERYFDIATAKAQSAAEAMAEDAEDLGSTGFDSSDTSMGDYYNFEKDANGVLQITAKKASEDPAGYSDWQDLKAGDIEKSADGKTATIKVEIKQETAGLYEVYIAGTKVAEYAGETKIPEDSKKLADKNYLGFAKGGVAVYANTPVGQKKGQGTVVVVNYKSDKDKTHGLYEEVDE